MFELQPATIDTKTEMYAHLAEQARALFEGERDFYANAANLSSLLFHSLPDLNWAGFYINRAEDLVLGPFQGKPACVRIPFDRGVCGRAAQDRKTVIVANVHEFPGRIACDSASNSEIVIPIVLDGDLIGVLDLDSPAIGRFDATDEEGLETLLEIFLRMTDLP